MNDYSKKSNYEISCEVGRMISFADYLLARNEQKNYCDSWADAGPIISNNKISLHAPSITKTWMAEFAGSDDDVNDGFHVDYFEHHHENPLRAAMIVFLMMKDSENANPS